MVRSSEGDKKSNYYLSTEASQSVENPESSTNLKISQKDISTIFQDQIIPFIGTRDQAPQWMKSQDLQRGYRINFSSFRLICQTLFMEHNETINIWTHLIGAIALLLFIIITSTSLVNLISGEKYASKLQFNCRKLGDFRNSEYLFFPSSSDLCQSQKKRRSQNNQFDINVEEMIRELCQIKKNKFQCEMKKFHQKKLRNWLQYNFGINFNNFQKIKIKLEKKIIPNFVHKIQNEIINKKNTFLQYLKLNWAHDFKYLSNLQNQERNQGNQSKNKKLQLPSQVNLKKFNQKYLQQKLKATNNEKNQKQTLRDEKNKNNLKNKQNNQKILIRSIERPYHKKITHNENSKPQINYELQKWPLILNLTLSSLGLFFSVIFHWFYPLSQSIILDQIILGVSNYCFMTDVAGVSLVAGGCPISLIYYGMYCYFEVAQIYLFGIIFGMIIIIAMSYTGRLENISSRVLVFVIFGNLMTLPLFHLTINEIIFDNYNDSFSIAGSLKYYIFACIFSLAGVVIYSKRIPDRFFKAGKLDIYGHSHQFWHVASFFVTFYCFLGGLQNYFQRMASVCAVTH